MLFCIINVIIVYIKKGTVMDIRQFVKKNKHFGWQNARRVRELSWVHEKINDRAHMHFVMHKHIRNGQIGLLVSGMDCDCVQFSYGSVVSVNSLAELEKHIASMYEWADGPLNVTYTTPEKASKYERQSRDLALEAFEDGHGHVVYA